MPRPIRSVIHLANLSHNLALARSLAATSNTFAVVKADAYGHGLLNAMHAFSDADGLALIEIENAVALRSAGWTKPLLLLEGCYDEADWQAAATHRFSVVVHCPEQMLALNSLRLSHRLNVFLKVNTGMNRLGFPVEELRAHAQTLLSNPSVASVTLMTHFARADEAMGYVEALGRFEHHASGLPLPRSLANSAACFDVNQANGALGAVGDWVRPGIMLYGATPFSHAARSAASLRLKAGMSLLTEVIATQRLKPGDTVGYGATYTAHKPERIAIIAAGYADGYPRHAPTGTPVIVNGVRTRIVGRVSMDKITVDITDIASANVGAPVELWGEHLPVDEVATFAGTIGYELLTAVAPRVPRVRT